MENTAPTEPDTTTSTSTHPRARVSFVTELAERAILVPVGAGLILRETSSRPSRDWRPSTRRAPAWSASSSASKRGARARNRFERQVTRRRKRVEREMRHRRRGVERAVKQNRGRLEREVRQVRKDLEKQSGVVSARVGGITARVEELVSNAQGLMS